MEVVDSLRELWRNSELIASLGGGIHLSQQLGTEDGG